MSEMGHSRRFGRIATTSGLASVADVSGAIAIFAFRPIASFLARTQDVCSSRDSGGIADIPEPPLGHKSRHQQRRGKSRDADSR
jgi:hypothetical protein